MPLMLDRRLSRAHPGATAAVSSDGRMDARDAAPAGTLNVGLLNNMPDAALRATERQFIDVLSRAAGPLTVRLHFFSLPGIARGEACLNRLSRAYGNLRDLTRARLDALIVTGSEPVAVSLFEEPYWDELAAVVDWAEHNTLSTIWSCLAAHAAVLHLDGIGRHRLPEKRFGLFECAKLVEHPLLEGTPPALRIPHSRWNDLRENDLRAHGYRILTRSPEAGIDMFVKQWRSTFLFFQGHPEYQPEALYREYRRDVQRFREGVRASMPSLPLHCFDPQTEAKLRAASDRGAEGHALAEATTGDLVFRPALVRVWRDSAAQIYRNWLGHLAAIKA